MFNLDEKEINVVTGAICRCYFGNFIDAGGIAYINMAIKSKVDCNNDCCLHRMAFGWGWKSNNWGKYHDHKCFPNPKELDAATKDEVKDFFSSSPKGNKFV